MPNEALPDEVFADTCILLNFIQNEWERDQTTALVTSESVTLIVSETVLKELADVSARRSDIYEDIVDYLIETESEIETYDPSERRVYIGNNDARHVRTIQEQLSVLEDKRKVLFRLRRFVRAVGRRVEYLQSQLEADAIDPAPPLELRFAIDRVLNHNADTRVVTDAAAWTASGGSGVLVTLDTDDLFQHRDQINEVLVDKQDRTWVLEITKPNNIPRKTTKQSD